MWTTVVGDGTNGGRLVLYGNVAAPGVTPAWPGGYAQLSGGSAFGAGPAGTAQPVQVSVHGMINVSGVTGNLYIQPAYYPYNTGSESPQCKGDSLLEVNIWRPTGVPQ